MILAGLLALPGTAMAKYDMNGGIGSGMSDGTSPCANQILDICAPAGRPPGHPGSGGVFEGTG